MSSASRIIRNSREFCNGQHVLSSKASILGRYFSTNGSTFAGKGNDIVKGRQCGLSGKENRCMEKDFVLFKASSVGIFKSFARTNMNGSIPMAGMGLSYSFSGLRTSLRRGFSSSSELPHQEIGVPSLSPTMIEGNISPWLKKEGDKVSPGEVLCAVETDKETVEMECTEEGSMTKTIHGDGAKDTKFSKLQAKGRTRLYFVHLGWIPHDDPNVGPATHIDILTTVLRSKEKAMSAVERCLAHLFVAFTTRLTKSQANVIAELPGVFIRPKQNIQIYSKKWRKRLKQLNLLNGRNRTELGD